MSIFDETTDAGVTAGLAAAAQAPQRIHSGELYNLVLPPGFSSELLDTEKHLSSPFRKRGTVTLLDATSFAAYVVKHKEPENTELYADPGKPGVTAVLNGHGPTGDADIPDTGWGDHRAVLVFRETEQWKHWTSRNNTLGGQVDFAEHIENGIGDIASPPGADMLEMAQSFQAKTKVAFESGKDLTSGERQLVYREELEATAGRKGDITIPREFTLGIAPYEGSAQYKVTARLRYRITDGALRIGYVLERPDLVLRAAFDDVLVQVQEQCGQVALLGTAAPAGA